MDYLVQYAPLIIALIAFLSQYKIFITPEQLEKKHREIIENVETRFASNQCVSALKEQISDMKSKVDKIYDFIITK